MKSRLQPLGHSDASEASYIRALLDSGMDRGSMFIANTGPLVAREPVELFCSVMAEKDDKYAGCTPSI